MRLTGRLLSDHGACISQLREFVRLYPRGVQPTVEALTELASRGLDVWWLARLLPNEGPGSSRAYALWCAQQVAHLCADSRVAECLAVVAARVDAPASVSGDRLAAARAAARAAAWDAAGDAAWAAARAAAWDAAGDAAWDAAGAAARAAAWDAAGDAAGDAQVSCLSQLLLEAP